MSDYLKRKKEEEERRKQIDSNVGKGNMNVNGQTLEQWRRGESASQMAMPKMDNEERNIYGQTLAEYRKMRSEGGKLNSLQKWKGATENLLREYDKYSYSGRYQTEEEYESFAKRLQKQLNNTDSLKEKYKGNISEIDDVIERVSKAIADNEEGRKYFSQWDDDETYQQFLQYQRQVEEQQKAEEAKVQEKENGKKEFQTEAENLDYQSYLTNLGNNPMYSQSASKFRSSNLGKTDGELAKERAEEKKALERKQYEKNELERAEILQKAQTATLAKDFDEKSKYVKTGGKGWRNYEDRMYEYINDADSGYKKTYGLGRVDISSQEAQQGYNYITDEERGIYNYIYATDGAKEAKKYLEALGLTQRMTEDAVNIAEEYAEEHPWLSSGETIVSNVIHAGEGYTDDLLHRARGEAIDPYSYGNLSYNTNTAIRGTVEKNIDSPVGKFMYQNGMSMADFLATNAVAGAMGNIGINPSVASTLIMGSNAATSAVIDAKARGVSDEQALMTGFAQGAAEAVFEKLSIEQLEAFSQVAPDSIKNVVMNTLKGFVTEGSEETFTSIANAISDHIINGDLSAYNWKIQTLMEQGYSEEEAKKYAATDFAKQIGLDFLGGGITGGIMSGGVSTASWALNRGTENVNNGTEQETEEMTENPEEESQTAVHQNETLEEENETIPEEIPWEEAQMYSGEDMISENTEVAPAQPVAGVKEVKTTESKKKQAARDNINTILQYGKVDDVMASEIVKNPDMKAVMEEKTGVEFTGTDEEQKNGIKEIVRLYGERYGSTVSKNMPLTSSGRQNASVKGRNVEIIGVQSKNGSEPKFRSSDGQIYNYDEISFKDDNSRKLYAEAAQVAIDSNESAANEFIKGYKTSYPIQAYSKGFQLLYNAGRNGVPVREAMNAVEFMVRSTDMGIMSKAWTLGYNAREQENVAVEAKQQQKKGKGTFEDQTRQGGPIADIARLVADRTGIDIIRKSNLKHDANAAFIPSTMTLLLSENAQNEYTSLIHELGEFGLSYNREDMKQIQDAIVKYWAEKNGKNGLEDIDVLVKDYQRRYAEAEGSKTKSQAMDEIINDALGGLFSTESGANDFIQWLQKDSGYNQTEQRTIIQKIIDTLDQVVDYLKNLIKDSGLTRAARKAAQMEEQRAHEIRQMFLDALEGAIETANTTGKYTTDAAIKNSLKDFAEQYDAWDGKDARTVFDVTIATDVYKFIGKDNKTIRFDASKIIKIKAKHAGMTDTVIKQIPEVLNNPVLIMKSKQSDTRIVTTGILQDEQNKPVVVVLELEPTGRSGIVVDEIKVASAYGKDGMQNFINKSEILYTNPNKQIINRWTKRTRLQLPVGKVSVDYNNIVSDTQENATHETKFSLREDYDALEERYRNTLRENDTYKTIIDSLESKMNIQKGISVSKESAEKAADKMYRRYKSTYDKADFTDKVAGLFQSGETNKGNFLYIAEQIMRPVIESSKNNLEISDYAKGILKDIKKTSIKIDETQRNEVVYHYGTFNDYRKSLFGRVTFTDKGTSLDTLWKQWSEAYPEWFDEGISPVDQPVKLAEIVNNLKEDYSNEYGFTLDDAVSYAAMELMNDYANLPEVKGMTDKAASAQFKSQYMKLTNAIKKEYQEKYEKQIAKLKEENAQAVRKNRDRLLEQEAKFRARTAETRMQRQDRHARGRYMKNLQREVSTMKRWFESNSDKNHVPEVLKDMTMDFFNTLDFLSDRSGNKTVRELQFGLIKLQDKYTDLKKNELCEDFYSVMDVDFEAKLQEIRKQIGRENVRKIPDMGNEELKELSELATSLRAAISNMNKSWTNQRYETISQVGEASIRELSELRRKPNWRKLTIADDLLNLHMLDAESFFEQMGDAAHSIYRSLREGFDKRTWNLDRAGVYMKDAIGKTDISTWTGAKAELHKFGEGENEFEMTSAQLMTLYELSKRPQGMKHLESEKGNTGGFVVEQTKDGKKQKTLSRPIRTDKQMLERMFERLTPEQKELADKMQKFLAKDCADWGNEVTMRMHLYKKYGEAEYWPIKSYDNSLDANNIKKKSADVGAYHLKNLGHTKNLNEKASNPVLVEDIFDVFVEHVANMANYNAFVLPLEDAMRWYNYKRKNSDGEATRYLMEEMERAFGKGAKNYFEKFIRDVNGEAVRSLETSIGETLTRNYKASAVSFSSSVVIQQPCSYIRAACVMNPKYLTQAAASMKFREGSKEAIEHSAIAKWKSWGFFETNIGMSMKSLITGQKTFKEKFNDAGMYLAQKADEMTLGNLWNAAKLEIADKYKDIDTSSEEYIELVRKRFDEVVDRTQVVDTVFHRSQIMRSQNAFAKMTTAFMTEPTKNYNLLRNAAYQWQTKKNKAAAKSFGAIFVSLVISAIATSAASAVVGAFRDDDEEKEWGEKWLENFWSNTASNIIPLAWIPWTKDIMSLLEGYDVSRMDMAGMDTLITALKQGYKYYKGDSDKTAYGVCKNIIRGVSQVSGHGMYNILREFETIVEQFTFAPLDENKPTHKTVRIRLLKAMNQENDKQLKKWLAWYDEKYREKIADGKTDKDARKDLKTGITGQFKEIYQNSTNAEKIKIKQLLLKIGVGGKQLYKDYDWSDWDKKKED